MQIRMKAKGELVGYHGVVNKARDGTKRYVDVEFGRDREQLAKAIGEELTAAVFAGYAIGGKKNGEEADGVWSLKSAKLSDKVVAEVHKITIDGESYQGQPQIVRFEPIEGTETVVMVIRLELGQAQTKLRQICEANLNCNLSFVFIPSKVPLPLKDEARSAQMEIIEGGVGA